MTREVREPPLTERPLEWIGDVLGWTFASPGAVAPDGRRYRALPSAQLARILVPEGTGARGALSSFNDSMTQLARMKKSALGTYLRLVGRWAPGVDRVVVRSHGPAGDGDTIERLVEGVVGAPSHLGVALGPSLRPNRKPVLQIVDRQGRIVAFAKIGWNDHTRALIDAEGMALAHLARQQLSFQIPEVLYHGDWHGRSVLVVSAGPTSLLRGVPRNQPPPILAELDVARSGSWVQQPLVESAYVAGLRTRIEDPGVTPETRDRLLPYLDGVVGTSGDEAIAFGAWHGDWAPWNMISSRERLFVLDWERYSDPVPVGFDHLHLRFQLAHQVAGSPIDAAASVAVGSLGAVAEPLGIHPGTPATLLGLYLMERALRVEMGSAAGMATRDSLVATILTYLEAGAR